MRSQADMATPKASREFSTVVLVTCLQPGTGFNLMYFPTRVISGSNSRGLPAPATLMLALLLFSLIANSTSASAGQCQRQAVTDRPKIGLALGGGGARGFAHVGVIKALEELRIPYDYVAGTSMGSIVGGLLATGMDSDEISTLVEGLDWDELFTDSTPREDLPMRRKGDDSLGLFGPKLGVGKDSTLLPPGMVAGQKILFMFETITSQRVQAERFDQLPLPYKAVATNIIDGQIVVLDQGSLAVAMRASMAVPGAFDPVSLQDKLLVDGGLVRNLPVDIAREMGAETVIAVNVGTPLLNADEFKNVISIIEQLSGLAIVQNTQLQIESLRADDILITPQLGKEIGSASFDKFSEAWPLGYEATMAVADQLSGLSLSEQDYARWRAGITACVTGPANIQFVRLDNQSRFSDEVIKNYITIEPGSPLDIQSLERDIEHIYGLGFIRLARYHVVEENGNTGVVISVYEDERGPNYIETGLTLTGGNRGTNINLQGAFLKTNLDERGSELRAAAQVGDDFGLLLDYYRYMDDQQRWIFNPSISFSRRNLILFTSDGLALAETEINQALGGVRIGREYNRHGLAYMDLVRYTGSLDVTLGIPFEDEHYNGAELRAGLIYDRLDNLNLPSSGSYMELEYTDSLESLGADADFEQIRFRGIFTRSFGPHNLILNGTYNTTLDDNAPIYSLFTAGGFFNMSGFEEAELFGQHFGMAGAGYRYQVAESRLLPGYAGLTVEYGNAVEERSDIFAEGILNGSVYFAYNTPIGAVYLGYGWSEDRSGLLFLRLGTVLGSETVGQR